MWENSQNSTSEGSKNPHQKVEKLLTRSWESFTSEAGKTSHQKVGMLHIRRCENSISEEGCRETLHTSRVVFSFESRQASIQSASNFSRLIFSCFPFSFRNYNYFWVPIVGPLIGAPLGAFLYQFTVGFHWPLDKAEEGFIEEEVSLNGIGAEVGKR